jgi:hypothetical protein
MLSFRVDTFMTYLPKSYLQVNQDRLLQTLALPDNHPRSIHPVCTDSEPPLGRVNPIPAGNDVCNLPPGMLPLVGLAVFVRRNVFGTGSVSVLALRPD